MELKQCPHCGEKENFSERVEIEWPNDVTVRCNNCGALGPPCSTWPQAQKMWNERKSNKHIEPTKK